MVKTKPRCAVIGAANIDIGGFPTGLMTMGDSNPGHIRVSAGGVGRNIACGLARLGVEAHLVTALGGDIFAEAVRADCEAAGVLLDHVLVLPTAPSSAYMFIADAAGEMRLAVNDMSICESLTPEALAPLLSWLNGMELVVLEANLPPETLGWLAENLRVPLLADAVSAAKARRLLPLLPRLWALKPNALEASALTELPLNDSAAISAVARRLHALGLKRAFITLGERGVCCMEEGHVLFVPGAPVRLVNATGAGDAFTAALAWAALRGLGLREAALAGLAAAAITVESPAAVSAELTEAALSARMEKMMIE